MRAYGISVGILAAILVFSLWNSSYMTASTVRWREQLQQADAQAQSEAWTEAVDTLAGSYDDWSESQTYLHIVARHDTVDDAEAMYRRALAFAATREFCRSCSISSAIFSSSAKGTGRFSQARIMPPSTFRRSKLWRLPSFFTTTIGRLSTVS